MSFMTLNLLSHNGYCSVGVMESRLLNLLMLTDCFLCNSYHCVLFESFSNVLNQESHVYSENLWKIYLARFLKFSNLEIFSNFQFHNLKKVNSVNLSQNYLLNMSLLVQVCLFTHFLCYGMYWSQISYQGHFHTSLIYSHVNARNYTWLRECLDYFQDENWGET